MVLVKFTKIFFKLYKKQQIDNIYTVIYNLPKEVLRINFIHKENLFDCLIINCEKTFSNCLVSILNIF